MSRITRRGLVMRTPAPMRGALGATVGRGVGSTGKPPQIARLTARLRLALIRPVMRIIAGEYRSRRLEPPPDATTTRPMPDYVRESLFNLLRGHFEDQRVVDAFAGVGAARTLFVDGKEVDLTAREYALLETFLRHPDQVLSREQLLSIVWGYDFDPGSNVVEVYVGYLRRKLGNGVVETVRNMGYRLPGPT